VVALLLAFAAPRPLAPPVALAAPALSARAAHRAAPLTAYRFNVTDLNMQVLVQSDSKIKIIYDITFANTGQTIDIVDIGMPHSGYNRGNMSAHVDGVPVSYIADSEYVHPGVEVHLGSNTILSNQTKTLHFEFTIGALLYQDVTRQDYASLQITPTWFDSQFISGSGNINVVIYTPPGVKPEEIFSQDVEYNTLVQTDDHYGAAWHFEGRADHAYRVGLSFPKGHLAVIQQSWFDVGNKWLNDNEFLKFIVGGMAVIAVSILFLRFTGGTGGCVWVLLAGASVFITATVPLVSLFAIPVLGGLIIWNELHLANRRAKYLPPVTQVEGGGIKRGLTAPEAAALLELPLGKVLGLVIFGLLKKGALVQVADQPLTVRLAEAFKVSGPLEGRAKQRLHVAQQTGLVLHEYEHAFLEVIDKTLDTSSGAIVEKLNFGPAMKGLLQFAADRVKGFDLSDTQDYYRQIVQRAVKSAQGVGDMAQREQWLDRNLEWVLMDQRASTLFTPTYRPIWIRRGTWGGMPLSGSLSGSGKGSTSPVGGTTSFGDFAGGFAGWAENSMGAFANTIAPGSVTATTPRGVVDLRGVDKATDEFFKALNSSSGSGRRGGGGGRSCACACAGCACACACAGGGR
jgi:hypothetical protein